jgi:hypothetical protein
MFTQADWDHGVVEVAPSRFLAKSAFWSKISDHDFDPESFVPVDLKAHALAHAIKGDTEFATDDKHGPLHGPIVSHLLKNQAAKVKTTELGTVHLARRVIIPGRNLTVWVYSPEAESVLRTYHADGVMF